MSTESSRISVTIEFGGGAELLFDKKKKHEVSLPGDDWTIEKLLFWIRDNLLKERPELFIQKDTVYVTSLPQKVESHVLHGPITEEISDPNGQERDVMQERTLSPPM
ncbi:Ubiquitin-related modifier 1 like protein [Eufriesea mexicana]|uniref:Ubiquitin-related modifier 1 n=1 Tax=Eufriesea mexicana TaxID=516756 RepID=A0A310SGX6_9HYME|nr:Ubiquitin-related modifier 1 like protein [Eufriesea mexicana]